MIPKLQLQQNKEHLINTKHPWIYAESLKIKNDIEDGEWVQIENSEGKILASGSFSKNSIISVRVFEFCEVDKPSENWWREKLSKSENRRCLFGFGKQNETTGYRLVFGESDSLPGLVIDRYDNVFVIQSSTRFIDSEIENISKALISLYNPTCIFNKSNLPARSYEKLDEVVGIIYGNVSERTTFFENGYQFVTDFEEGQKTGFYLDQKDLRKEIIGLKNLIEGKRVLNLFSYTGATSVYLLKNGAQSVHNVDISERALDIAAINAELNGLSLKTQSFEKADIFDWLEKNKNEKYDIVFVDPPALIKGKKYKDRGLKAYHHIFKSAMNLVNNRGVFVVSSCSQYLSQAELKELLKKASNQNNTKLDILSTLGQSADHPISLYFSESEYLKSLIMHKENLEC